MRLIEIGLDGFRNLRPARIEIPPHGAVLIGSNGQGKTNFLEAVHYLALFRSFRGARHREVIAFGEERFRVTGRVEYGDGGLRRVAVSGDRGARRIAIDGVAAPSPAEAVGSILSVLFAPGDLEIVAGPPAERRRFMDALLARAAGRHWRTIQAHGRALRQRNEALRGRGGADELEAWDESLIRTGTPVVLARHDLACRLDALFGDFGARIAPDAESGLELRYRPSVPVDAGAAGDAEAVRQAWREALARRRGLDLRRGWTSVGPHRDDLELLLGGRSIGRYASLGQQRTAAIALRLAEADILEAESGHAPVLLLDDVFAEVDADRSRALLPCLGEHRQRFVTSARPLPELDTRLEAWEVAGGRIRSCAVAA
ncbi:MAG TPA: DNA replication and repair protein RecF [Gemmatimonadota bacterium]|nr:DNA replication and repair protein RecF [Gemmatimonadota bacterium]